MARRREGLRRAAGNASAGASICPRRSPMVCVFGLRGRLGIGALALDFVNTTKMAFLHVNHVLVEVESGGAARGGGKLYLASGYCTGNK